MTQRYFLHEPPQGDQARLVGPEAHHLLHVMRGVPGTEITVFDGSGAEYTAWVQVATRSQVELRIVARREVDRELPFTLVLGVSLPKGDRQSWLVEKAVELGVSRLVPLATERSVAQPTETARARLRRAVVEASKQCGRNRLLEVGAPANWAAWLAAAPASTARILAHPGGSAQSGANLPMAKLLRHLAGQSEVWLAVGPEGGFADEEAAQARAAGWEAVDLGPRILRVETAALMLTGLAAAAHSAPATS
jgi:16S rRNA (uracil1498-N3)-methyltransferase